MCASSLVTAAEVLSPHRFSEKTRKEYALPTTRSETVQVVGRQRSSTVNHCCGQQGHRTCHPATPRGPSAPCSWEAELFSLEPEGL